MKIPDRVTRKRQIFIISVCFLAFLVFQGCYTQLAITKRVAVVEEPAYRTYQEVEHQAEELPDTLIDESGTPYTFVNEYNYWFIDPWETRYGFDPYFYDQGFYMNMHFTWGRPSWYPWHYTYPRGYWYRQHWTGWCWNYPIWYDPWDYYYAGYYPGYYPGWYAGYGDPYWGWYWPGDYEDPLPKGKREWDRRGTDLTAQTIVRPSGPTSGGNSGGVGRSVIPRTGEESGNTSARHIEHHRQESAMTVSTRREPIQRTGGSAEVRKTVKRESNDSDKSRTPRQVRSKDKQSSSDSGNRTVRRHRRSSITVGKVVEYILKSSTSDRGHKDASSSRTVRQSKNKSSNSSKAKRSGKRSSGRRSRR